MVGTGGLDIRTKVDFGRNWHLEESAFANASRFDYRLRASSRAVGMAEDPGYIFGLPLRPSREYVYPFGSRPLALDVPLSPGASQQVVRR
jgi:hypothetical protein